MYICECTYCIVQRYKHAQFNCILLICKIRHVNYTPYKMVKNLERIGIVKVDPFIAIVALGVIISEKS